MTGLSFSGSYLDDPHREIQAEGAIVITFKDICDCMNITEEEGRRIAKSDKGFKIYCDFQALPEKNREATIKLIRMIADSPEIVKQMNLDKIIDQLGVTDK